MSCADPETILRGLALDQGGSDKVLPFQNPYPGKLSGSDPLSPFLNRRMDVVSI